MPVPALLTDLSASASANSPQATETVGPIMNEYIQAAYAFIAQLYEGGLVPTAALNMNSQQINGLAAGVLSTDAANVGQLAAYLPLVGGALTGALTSNSSITINGGASSGLIVNSTGTTGINVQSITGTNGANICLTDNPSSSRKYLRNITNQFQILNNAYSAVLLVLDDSGNFTATGNVTAFSDERFKKNWTALPTDFLEKVAAVEKSGTYSRTDMDLRQAGVSAQDWQKILPETVQVDGPTGRLSVAYGNAALVTAIELAREVKALRERIEELERKQ